jgi:hypothetical protein
MNRKVAGEPELPIILVFEDDLSNEVLLRLIEVSGRRYMVGQSIPARGFGYIKKHIRGLNAAAKGMPILILTDLDEAECAPAKINDWLGPRTKKHPNLLFRIAVKEVEAWLLADREGFAHSLGISEGSIPRDPEALEDPKRALIDLARRSRKRSLRNGIAIKEGSAARQGPTYNYCLSKFVREEWDPERARRNSLSLQRTILILKKFAPVWGASHF